MCSIDRPTAAEAAAGQKAPRRRRGKTPATIDHELRFVALADLAEDWAKQEDEDARNWVPPSGDVKVVGGPSRGTAAKLLDVAIKARRAACALALAREDWEATDRLEKAARELDQDGPARGRGAASEVRH